MDEKSEIPVPPPATATESQPTIPPSAASMTEDDKVSSKGATASETDAASTNPTNAITGAAEADNEKSASNELKQQATATSKHGSTIEPSRTREDGVAYPKGYELFLITLALCLSVFLIALDNSIIATAIPKITDQFQSIPDIGWYGSGMSSPMRAPIQSKPNN